MKVLAALFPLLLMACATAGKPQWLPAGGRFGAPRAGFELEGPAGWVRYDAPETGEKFVATRDGVDLQRITALSSRAGEPLDLGDSARPFTSGMSAYQLAELMVEAVRSSRGISEVRVIESASARLAGRDGFRVLVSFRADGLTYRTVITGCADGERVYYALFRAPERHYFELDLATFERVLESYRLRDPAPVPQS